MLGRRICVSVVENQQSADFDAHINPVFSNLRSECVHSTSNGRRTGWVDLYSQIYKLRLPSSLDIGQVDQCSQHTITTVFHLRFHLLDGQCNTIKRMLLVGAPYFGLVQFRDRKRPSAVSTAHPVHSGSPVKTLPCLTAALLSH